MASKCLKSDLELSFPLRVIAKKLSFAPSWRRDTDTLTLHRSTAMKSKSVKLSASASTRASREKIFSSPLSSGSQRREMLKEP